MKIAGFELLHLISGYKCSQKTQTGNYLRKVNSTQTISHKNQSGLTLIEILIALVLGVFLISGIIQIFIANKQSYRLAEAQGRLQENARYALELLNHDIRLSGFIGCSSISNNNPTVIANNPLVAPLKYDGNSAIVDSSVVIGGDDNPDNNSGTFTSPKPAMSTSPLNSAIIGTDAITIQYGESCGGYVTSDMLSVDPTGKIAAANNCGINLGTGVTYATLGTPLIISDCKTAHIFRASAGTSQNKDKLPLNNGTATSTLIGKAGGYPVGSEVMLFRSYTYYIRQGASGQPSLWRLNNNYPVVANSNPEEMVEGVENMQILYGIETDTGGDVATLVDNSANRYVEADKMPNLDPTLDDWRRVVSVRVILTMRSIDDNLRPDDNSRPFNGNNAYKDRRIVRTFTSTIGLRNR